MTDGARLSQSRASLGRPVCDSCRAASRSTRAASSCCPRSTGFWSRVASIAPTISPSAFEPRLDTRGCPHGLLSERRY